MLVSLKRYSLVLLLTCLTWGSSELAFAQENTGTKASAIYSNRIEYRQFHWQAFHTSTFHLYFPKGADSLPAFIARGVLAVKAAIAKKMGTALSVLPAIIIYPSLTAQYESGIGSREETPLTLPTFVSRGSRIVLHYSGSYEDLKDQLYTAAARASWEREMGQNTINAQVKGAVKSDPIPYWYKEGAIDYFARSWPLQQEEALRRVFESDSPASFFMLAGTHTALTGAAFCYYLSRTTREDAPLQVFYLLRKGKPLDRALRLVTKTRPDSLYAGCYEWYRQRFSATLEGSTSLELKAAGGSGQAPQHADSATFHIEKVRLPYKARRKGKLLTALLDPSGKNLALTVSFPDHRRGVYLCDLVQHKAHKVATYELPPWLKSHESDPYPLLKWAQAGGELLVTYPQKGNLVVTRINGPGRMGEKTILPLIDGAGSVIPLSNDEYLLSAWLQGQSDLVKYTARTDKYAPLTNDAADDATPSIFQENTVSGKIRETNHAGLNTPIYFTSVRKGDTSFGEDTIPLRHGIYKVPGKVITPVLTNTLPHNTYTDPVLVDDQNLLLTATIQGRSRIALLDIKHSEASTPSHASRKVSEKENPALRFISDDVTPYQYLPAARTVAFFQTAGDSLIITTHPFDTWVKEGAQSLAASDTTAGPWLRDYSEREAARKKEDSVLKAAKAAGGPSFLDNVLGGGSAVQKKGKSKEDSAALELQYTPKKARPYVLQLYSAYFSTQVNNDYFINRYQPYGTFQGSFKFPEVGGMLKGGMSDLFEHHHISIAYRLPAGSEGSMFFTKYSNTAKRLDWSLAYYRNVESLHPDPARAWVDEEGRHYPNAAKVKTHYYELSLAYPLSYYSAIGSSLSFRKDRTVFLATDAYSLTFPALTDLWAGLSLWEETMHLRPTIFGLYRGWKGKLNGDVFKGFSGSESALSALSLSAEWHRPLYRYITLVAKGQAGISGGDKKVLYNLGGVDNNLTPRIDSDVHFSQNAPYAFQTLVTPFRGYLQNTLYGSKYALLNMDVYFPLFETLIPIETNFPSINHLQLGIFSEAAFAGGDSRYTTSEKGWQYSYGASARTILAGYPIRFDIGWPGSFSKKPVWYLSLNLQ